jgi:hypothetical protein
MRKICYGYKGNKEQRVQVHVLLPKSLVNKLDSFALKTHVSRNFVFYLILESGAQHLA